MGQLPPRYPEPKRRHLKIYAFDPLAGNAPGNKTSIDVPFEPLRPGPSGRVFTVIDYDATQKKHYEPVDLERQEALVNHGLDHSEFDPRFHQQMVYAVSSRVLENFEKALGRKVRFTARNGDLRLLKILPHAFEDANAYFDPELRALLFGYFRAESANAGRNLPGQRVFNCLSHDVIAHELTHAILHRLRRYYIEPTGLDAPAFHEGFSDIVALFQRFTYRDSLCAQLNSHRADFAKGGFLGLAAQFGQALGQRSALREGLNPDGGPPVTLDSVYECHDRGAVLVGAIFEALTEIFKKRVKDLYRIATGGSGILPEGDLHPDLIQRMADEAAKTADSLLTMCVRALDYMPPVDPTFGDFLRAIVTADRDLVSTDRLGQLDQLIEGFRKRKIYPRDVISLSPESLVLPTEALPPLPEEVQHDFWKQISFQSLAESTQVQSEAERYRKLQGVRTAAQDYAGGRIPGGGPEKDTFVKLWQYGVDNARKLGLADPERIKVHVSSYYHSIRVAPDRRWTGQTVIQFVQTMRDPSVDLGGLPLRGGTTLIADAEGRVRYLAVKPLPCAMQAVYRSMGKERLERMREYIEYCDARDPQMAWGDRAYRKNRMKARARFSALHDGCSF